MTLTILKLFIPFQHFKLWLGRKVSTQIKLPILTNVLAPVAIDYSNITIFEYYWDVNHPQEVSQASNPDHCAYKVKLPNPYHCAYNVKLPILTTVLAKSSFKSWPLCLKSQASNPDHCAYKVKLPILTTVLKKSSFQSWPLCLQIQASNPDHCAYKVKLPILTTVLTKSSFQSWPLCLQSQASNPDHCAYKVQLPILTNVLTKSSFKSWPLCLQSQASISDHCAYKVKLPFLTTVLTFSPYNNSRQRAVMIKQKRLHPPTQPAFRPGPLSARQRNAIQMAFRWWADGGLLLHVVWMGIK